MNKVKRLNIADIGCSDDNLNPVLQNDGTYKYKFEPFNIKDNLDKSINTIINGSYEETFREYLIEAMEYFYCNELINEIDNYDNARLNELFFMFEDDYAK